MYENFRHTHGSGSGKGPIGNQVSKKGNSTGSTKINGHHQDSKTSTMPSKSERLNSPNTSKWEPDVRMMMSTSQWLKVHGLKKHKLDMAQILPSIGFRHSDDYVQPLQKPVRARYCKGLFTQVPYRNGSVYNVIASKDKLRTIEEQIKQAISLYKRRLEWLTTESRRVFGVIEERCITIVLDIDVASDTQFDTFRHALIQVIKEQVIFIAKVNLIRCAADMQVWQEHAVCVTLESMEDALDWIWKLEKIVPRTSTCTVEAITKAISDQHVEAVYLFTEGTASDGSSELLKRKVEGSQVPIHVVSFNCNSPSTISYFKEIVKHTNGRFHAFSVSDEYDDTLAKIQSTFSDSDHGTHNGRGRGDGMPSFKLGLGVREDVISLWEELDEARNTLAEIQALQIELSDPKSTPISTLPPSKQSVPDITKPKAGGRSELYMSSKDWLKRHGLKNRKLGFYDLLQTLAFKHCDGVVDIQRPPGDFGSEAIVRPKLVNARYCDKFAHVRWKDGTIMHVHVSGPIHRNYEQRMLSALDSYRKRIEWLQQGSRELFGTVIEDQVTVLIDTSASMASRLFLVKDKLYRLMQEQLRHKLKFNLMKFDTKVQAWRDRLVDCNTHNMDNAWQWVKGLSTGGSTNTLAALKQALTDTQCHGIYLLTDGRPDQPPSSIHAQVHLLDPVPIHTISFNCADSEANEFLCQLSSATGGRFHYFSEDGYDINGPKPFESEDLRLLREEIERGLSDLKKIAMLRNECAQLDWYGSNTGRCSKSHPRSGTGPTRPTSARNTMIPSPPSTMRPSSARVRPASARSLPTGGSITRSSFKDYIVSDATKNIPSSKPMSKGFGVSETRSSQLRLGLRKQASSDWMLGETKEYLRKRPEDFKKTKSRARPKTTKKKKQAQQDKFDDFHDVSVKQWLKDHGLAARKLTILDALSPTLIPHTTKYVPILDKHVLSKVFDQVLPLAHTSGSNRDEVQLVNPQAVNLKSYEAKLEEAIKLYTSKLDEMVYFGLSDQERVKYPEDRIPSFSANRDSMIKDLGDQGWQVPQEDILLLEKEIEQANTFLIQSQDLRKASEQAAKEIAEEQRRARQEMENKRIEKIMTKSSSTAPTQPTPQGNKHRLRHHKVVARNEVDGFYYPGLVRKCINPRYVEVDFDGFERQVVGVRYVIPIEGARPCPSLKVGDYVLVRTPIPREETDDLIMDSGYCYVPGIVQVVPLRKATASKCYTILRFNGKKITSLRKDLIKISKARYTFACRYIRDALISAYKASCPFGLYPNGIEEGKDLIAVNTGKAKPEKPRSRSSSSASDHSDKVNDNESNRSRSKSPSNTSSRSSSKSPERSKSRSRSRSRSKSPAESPSRSRSPSTSRSNSPASSNASSDDSDQEKDPPSPKSPKRRSRSPTDHFEDLKKELDEKHATQLSEIKEQRAKLEQLQQQLTEEQQKQREHQLALEQKQKELQEKQDQIMQNQIEEHKEKQNRLQEEQKRLQDQQEELLKKQKDQQEQLLMQQYNQNQSLQLQQQQLMQMLATGQQTKKDQAVETSPTGSPHRTPQQSPSASPRRTPKPSPRQTSHNSPQRSADSSPKNSKPASNRSTPKSSRRSSRKPSTSSDRVDASASDTDSSSSSDSETSSKRSKDKDECDDVDGRKEAKADEEDAPPNIQFHLSGNNEACLLTKGSHGLLISRLPPDVDPAIETRHVPKNISEGQEVLARWADEGWYYRGTVRQDCGDGSFFVEDSVGDLEQIPRTDIITDEDDADNVVKEGDPIVGLHPSFSYSYAPGVVIGLEGDTMHQVRYYDGIEAMVPREELYLLSREKFESDCAYILACEESLVGQAVVARNDDDGTFHLGTVRERVGNGRQYIIEWADQSVQLQSSGYIFGAHTKRHPLSIGDRVLALADPATYVYVPGWITGSNGRRLVVKFCNGKSSSHVDPLQCFWLSRDYYDRVVEFFKKRSQKERP